MFNYSLGLLFGLVTLILFQNCSNNKFSATDSKVLNSRCAENPLYDEACYNRVQETHTKSLSANPTDILFVLDESCSMETIANQVRDGFNSLLNSRFPANTKMALTYMSPAYVADDATIDYLATFPELVTETQHMILASSGHLKLVQRSNLVSYRNGLQTHLVSDATKFNYAIAITDFQRLFPGIDYRNPATGLVVHSDGLRLITKYDPAFPLTDTRRNTTPTAVEAKRAFFSSKIALDGCDKDWFDPQERDETGSYCLSAAVQLAPVCTGVEAGIVSLAQTLKKYTDNGQKLFRDGSKINIILVSDTHESGYISSTGEERYFGRPGAPKERLTQADLQSLILQNNPSVSSIKIHGILPLPEAGNPLLEGLNYVGSLPQTPAESVINSEGTNGFAYLPYIKETRGIAAHAANNNWSSIADHIVQNTNYSGSIFITLKKKASKILAVQLNGSSYDLSKVVLSSDGRSLSLTQENNSNSDVQVNVIYQADVPMPE